MPERWMLEIMFMVVVSSSMPVTMRKTLLMAYSANRDSIHCGSRMEPWTTVVLGEWGMEDVN